MKTRQWFALASALIIFIAGLTSCNKANAVKDADKALGKYEITDASTGEIIAKAGETVTREKADLILGNVTKYVS